jgi:REP element-mobilizing transposase RayT
MPRDDLLIGRASLSGHAYHVTACTDARRPVFRDLRAGRLLVSEMRALHDSGAVASLAWVIMPDHLHWLFQLGDSLSLSQVIKQLKARSALQINALIGRQGAVWQRGFHDHGIRAEEDLRAVSRYIVANPLRAGLVRRIGDYALWDAIWV